MFNKNFFQEIQAKRSAGSVTCRGDTHMTSPLMLEGESGAGLRQKLDLTECRRGVAGVLDV